MLAPSATGNLTTCVLLHHSSDPNFSGEQCVLVPSGRAWPLYEPVGQRYLVLSAHGGATGHALRAAQCALWSQLVPRLNNDTEICGAA